MAHDANPSNAMMQTIECCALELFESGWNDAAHTSQHSVVPSTESYVERVRHEMSGPEVARVGNELIELASDRGIIGGDYRSRAGADDDIDRNVVGGQLLQHAYVPGTAQASPAQDDPNLCGPRWSASGLDPLLQMSAQVRPPA